MLKLILMRNAITLLTLLLIFSFSGFCSESEFPPDTSFVVVKGSVNDKETGEPILFASVYLVGTNIGGKASAY